jgi:hypothetical protein
MPEELISVIEIARTHGTHKAQVFKILKRLGIESRKLRSEDTRGQSASFIFHADYERLKRECEPRGGKSLPDDTETNWVGYLYVVQLEPDLDPERFKIGFASSVEDRLRKHRAAAPFAKPLFEWPCKLLWENTAIDSITRGCERLHTEVFRAGDLAAVGERGDEFFAILPTLTGMGTDKSSNGPTFRTS